MSKLRIRENVTANEEGVTTIVKLVRECVEASGAKKSSRERTILAVEEAGSYLAAHAPADAKLRVVTRSFGGRVTIELSAPGDRLELPDKMKMGGLSLDDVEEPAQELLSAILLKSNADNLKYRYSDGHNKISFTILQSPNAHLYLTLASMVVAVLVGILLSELGIEPLNQALSAHLFVPGKVVYMNALKLIIAPVVFFSIVSCVMQFSDIKELGRIGGKIMAMYVLTTLIAIGVGLGVFRLIQPGKGLPVPTVAEDASAITSKEMSISLTDTLVNIVPSNLIQPFVQSNMLQLIFLAVLIGIVVGQIGRSSEVIKSLFEAFNELFLRVTGVIIQFMPFAVFCSICSMMLDVGPAELFSVLGMFMTFVFGLVCMLVAYCLLILILGRLNPLHFLKKYGHDAMAQIFSLGSSNASIPINMNACDNLGISKRVYSLSIPLGATVNMDGECVYLAVFALALANLYGVDITGSMILSIVISIVVLSMGAPGIPGVGLICLSVLLVQIGVPAEAIGLVMGVDALVGMFRCMNNCTGDAVASLIVARNEKLLDLEKYRSKDSGKA